MVPEDVNDVRFAVAVSNLLSVEGSDGSVADCFACDDLEGNSSNYQKSVM